MEQCFYQSCSNEIDSKEAEDLKLLLENLRSKVENHYEAYHYYLGINDIMECLRATNLVIHTEKPWELKKNGNLQRLGYVLNLSLQSVRICGILLRPQI